MSRPILSEAVWQLLEPLLPVYQPSAKGGRPGITNRQALTGILFILRTGMAWEELPTELNWSAGMSCWRYLRDWQADGTWQKIHSILLQNLDLAGKIDWERAVADSSGLRAVFEGDDTGPNPTDRAKNGSKHHILTDGNGIPLNCLVSAANRNDVTRLIILVATMRLVVLQEDREQKMPRQLLADRASDSEPHRNALRFLED